MIQAVQEIILGPMVELFPPPMHLRDEPEAQARALATYERVLSPFDHDTLAKAWDAVVAAHSYWVWPDAGTIAAACRAHAPKVTGPSDQEKRRQAAITMTDAYATKYRRTSQLAKLAEREGWLPKLMQYVHDAAWVQAQLLCGVKDIGWDSSLMPDADRYGSAQEAFAAYRQTIAKPVEKGCIRVIPPKTVLARWKAKTRKHSESSMSPPC